jgi:sulfate permease, SulP family
MSNTRNSRLLGLFASPLALHCAKTDLDVLMLKKYFPFLGWFPMRGDGIRADLIAGLTVALVLIPQSMAYAELAGLPIWMGLYAAFIPVVLAGLWGSSNHLQTGPGATMAFIISSALIPLAAVGSTEYNALAVQLAFMVGIIWALVAILRLSFVMNFLSRPVIEGFINAGGILIAASQVGKILGIQPSGAMHVVSDLVAMMGQLDTTNWISMAMGTASLLLLLLGRRFFPRVPVALIVATVSTAMVYFLGLANPEHVAFPLTIVGEIPSGLPKPMWPVPTGENVLRLLPGALVFAFVGFMETTSVARGIAARSHQKLSVNQEAAGQALASLGSAFSGGQPINGSFSRSALNFATGAKSGMAAVFTGLFVMVFLLFCTPLFYHLPKTVLAAIIISAVLKLINFRQLASFMKVSKADGATAWITFAATLAFAPELEKGILLGASFSILMHLYSMMRPHVAVLGRHPDGALRDADLHDLEIDHVLPAIRFDGRLFFANAAYFEDQVHSAVDRIPDVQRVAIIFNGINAIDSSGTEMLKELHGQLNHRGVQVLFVGVKNQVLKVIRASGLEDTIGKQHFFGTYDHARDHAAETLATAQTYSI